MPLEPLRIIKNWMKNLRAREQCWDEIADKVTAFAGRTNNNLKQLGLDIGGSSYDFNNNGVRTQTTPITTRLSALESVEYAFGVRNLGLDLTDPAKVKIVSADGTDLSSSNKGYVTFNSTTDAGQLVTREITANIEMTLTGAHWGFGTLGDLSDQILHIMMIDTGSQAILGVGIQAGRQTVTQADDETVATSVTAETDVLVSSALSAENNCIYLGYVKANFDDTGNANGEDYWAIQTGVGDINVGRGEPSLVDGRFTGDVSVGDDLTVGGDATVTGTLSAPSITSLTVSPSPDDCVPTFNGATGALQYSGVKITPALVTTSSVNTSFTDTTVVDGSAWDLSGVTEGLIALASGGSIGQVASVDDGSDEVTVADWLPANPSAGETVEIYKYDLRVPGDLTLEKGVTSNLVLEANSGDSVLKLRVNNSADNEWAIYNDNSASDNLYFKYAATNGMQLTTGGTLGADGAMTAPYFLPTGDDTSAPAANRLYKANVPKAWALLNNTTGAITADHNISGYNVGTGVVTIDTDMADANYAVVATVDGTTGADACITLQAKAAGTFTIMDQNGAALANGFDVMVVVMGNQ